MQSPTQGIRYTPVRFGLAMVRDRNSRSARLAALSIAPTLGLLTAHLAGEFDALSSTEPLFWAGQVYAALCGWILWWSVHGINRWLNWYQRWIERPFGRTLLPAACNVVLSVAATFVLHLAWRVLSGQQHLDTTPGIVLVAAGATAIFDLGYRISFVHALRVRAVRRIAMLEQAAERAQMAALKAQLDPHFLANSLNVFCHLVASHPDAATRFADNLSWIYRYVLENGQKDLVRLDAELEFVDRYVELLRLRFGDGIVLRVERENTSASARWLPPLAMQTLLENAVKHNAFSADEPLVLALTVRDDNVEAVNPVRNRSEESRGGGLGLTNLANRVRLLTGLSVRVERRPAQFCVTVPLIAEALP